MHRWGWLLTPDARCRVPRHGHNGFSLLGEIAINSPHLATQDSWQVLETLFHELLHAWQQGHGRPGKRNYHNHELRGKARAALARWAISAA